MTPGQEKGRNPLYYLGLRPEIWRRRRESNPRMTVLQTIALPLGYSAVIPKREAIE